MHHSPLSSSSIVRLLLLLLLATSASCAYYYDPGYKELLAVADNHPPKSAIVGMWTRSHPGSLMVHKHSATEMYRSDGTGLWSLRQSGALSFLILVPDNAKKLTWSADGSGGWHVSHGSGQSAECRMSNGKLLQKRWVIDHTEHWVLNPVSAE